MLKLTLENYFTPDNNYLTNSKIGDWLKSKEYFYRKHITHELANERKACYDTGTAVDDLLTQIDNRKNYVVVSRRNLKNPPDGVIELLPQQYDEIVGLADAVAKTDAYKELADHTKQMVLQYDMPVGAHLAGLAGIPDFIKIEGNKVIITDLKTAQTIDERRYHYHALEYGYYRQAGFYLNLVRLIFPEVKDFECRHLVVEKQKEIWNVEVFELAKDRIEEEVVNIRRLIADISMEKEFKKYNPTFFRPTLIGALIEVDEF